MLLEGLLIELYIKHDIVPVIKINLQPIITNPGPGLVRSSRRASQGPLYYNTYRMPAKVLIMMMMSCINR